MTRSYLILVVAAVFALNAVGAAAAAVPPATAPAGSLTDKQMDQLAETAAVAAQKAMPAGRPMMPGPAAPPVVHIIQSKNVHLGETTFKSPFLKHRFYCATLGHTTAAPIRQFICVSRGGQVTAPFTAARFGAALAAEDTSKWADDDWLEAARMFVHLQSVANEDGWRLLAKPEDLTSIKFNIDNFPAAKAKRDDSAKQIVKPVVTREKDTVVVEFYAWHLIGGRLVLWTVQLKPEVSGTPKNLGQFGGGGYD